MISSFQVWTSVGTLVGTIVDNFTSKITTRESYLIPLWVYLSFLLTTTHDFLRSICQSWVPWSGSAE